MDIAPCPTANLVLGNLNQKPIEEIMKNSGQKFQVQLYCISEYLKL